MSAYPVAHLTPVTANAESVRSLSVTPEKSYGVAAPPEGRTQLKACMRGANIRVDRRMRDFILFSTLDTKLGMRV